MVGKRTLGGEAAWRVPRGVQPRHAALALAGGLVGVLRAVVARAGLAMCHAREALARGRARVLQCIGDDPPGHLVPALAQCPAAWRRRLLLPTPLHANIQDSAGLIARPREGRAPWLVSNTSSRGHGSPGLGRRLG